MTPDILPILFNVKILTYISNLRTKLPFDQKIRLQDTLQYFSHHHDDDACEKTTHYRTYLSSSPLI